MNHGLDDRFVFSTKRKPAVLSKRPPFPQYSNTLPSRLPSQYNSQFRATRRSTNPFSSSSSLPPAYFPRSTGSLPRTPPKRPPRPPIHQVPTRRCLFQLGLDPPPAAPYPKARPPPPPGLQESQSASNLPIRQRGQRYRFPQSSSLSSLALGDVELGTQFMAPVSNRSSTISQGSHRRHDSEAESINLCENVDPNSQLVDVTLPRPLSVHHKRSSQGHKRDDSGFDFTVSPTTPKLRASSLRSRQSFFTAPPLPRQIANADGGLDFVMSSKPDFAMSGALASSSSCPSLPVSPRTSARSTLPTEIESRDFAYAPDNPRHSGVEFADYEGAITFASPSSSTQEVRSKGSGKSPVPSTRAVRRGFVGGDAVRMERTGVEVELEWI